MQEKILIETDYFERPKPAIITTERPECGGVPVLVIDGKMFGVFDAYRFGFNIIGGGEVAERWRKIINFEDESWEVAT